MTFDEWLDAPSNGALSNRSRRQLMSPAEKNASAIAWQSAWHAATKAEREACAEICDDCANETDPHDFALDALRDAVAAIKARGTA